VLIVFVFVLHFYLTVIFRFSSAKKHDMKSKLLFLIGIGCLLFQLYSDTSLLLTFFVSSDLN